MKKYIILLIFFVNVSYAKNYSLYLASSKTIEVAAYFYYDIKKYVQKENNVVIHKTKKNEYLILIKDIKSIQKANLLKRILRIRYRDSYIRLIKDDSFYNLVSPILSKKTEKTEILPYLQAVENSNRYITATILYNTKEYQKAYEMFYDLFLEHSDNVNINYFLAKSAFNLKKYDEATAAFERVLIAKPDFDVARYEYANLLYLLKNDSEAKNEFETLLKKEINTSIKEEIKKSLLVIENRNKRISGNLNLMIGLTTSSNVNNGLINTEYKLPGLNDITVEGEEPISDSAHNEAINLNLFNYIDSKPIRVKNSFLIYNKSFFNEKDQNFTLFSYKPSIDYLFKSSLIGLEFSLDKILKTTDEDFFAYSISPKFSTKNIFSYLKYQRVLYDSQSQEGKNFEQFQIFTNIKFLDYLNFYTNLYKNQRLNDLRIDIDKYTIGNGINLFYNLPNNDLINLNYEFDYSKYKYENSLFENKREDTKHIFNLSYKYIINNDDTINLSTSYIKNNSNQNAYSYDEKAFKLNYIKSYKW